MFFQILFELTDDFVFFCQLDVEFAYHFLIAGNLFLELSHGFFIITAHSLQSLIELLGLFLLLLLQSLDVILVILLLFHILLLQLVVEF